MAVGYYLRLIISLGKKGSMELEIKEMLLAAKEEAKKITADAEAKSAKTIEGAQQEIKEKENKIHQTEDRLIKKEDLLDKRQTDIDKEVEMIKTRVAEIVARNGFSGGTRYELYHAQGSAPRFLTVYDMPNEAVARAHIEGVSSSPPTTPGPASWRNRDRLWRVTYGRI